MTRHLDAQFLALEESLQDPGVRRDLAALDALIADDFVEIGASGVVYDKRQVIDALATEAPVRVEISDLRAEGIREGVVLVTFTAIQLDTGGRRRQSRRASLWIRDGHRFRLRFHQGTAAGE